MPLQVYIGLAKTVSGCDTSPNYVGRVKENHKAFKDDLLGFILAFNPQP